MQFDFLALLVLIDFRLVVILLLVVEEAKGFCLSFHLGRNSLFYHFLRGVLKFPLYLLVYLFLFLVLSVFASCVL